MLTQFSYFTVLYMTYQMLNIFVISNIKAAQQTDSIFLNINVMGDEIVDLVCITAY